MWNESNKSTATIFTGGISYFLCLVFFASSAQGQTDTRSGKAGDPVKEAQKDTTLCLPVVVPKCGCAYGCGKGTRRCRLPKIAIGSLPLRVAAVNARWLWLRRTVP